MQSNEERKRKRSDINDLQSDKKSKVACNGDTEDNFETIKIADKSEILSDDKIAVINNEEVENKIEKNENVENAEIQSVSNLNTTDNKISTTEEELKLATGLVNTNLLLPFKLGWRRELVRRCIGTNSKSDVYYFCGHTGKKFRSLKEVSRSLEKTSELTVKNFSFSQKRILANENLLYEIERKANPYGFRGYASKKNNLKSLPKLPKANEVAKNSVEPVKTQSEPVLSENGIEFEKRTDLICSKRCRNMRGVAPTLQCIHCMNLYHPQCGVLNQTIFTSQFVCINCKSSKSFDAESEVINSNFGNMSIDNEEQQDNARSTQNLPQTVEFIGSKKYMIIPISEVPPMPFDSDPDNLIQINIERALPGNKEETSLELFNRNQVIEMDIDKVDED